MPGPAPGGLSTMSSELANASHYYEWIYGLIKGHIGDRVLEVGAGAGAFTRFLLDRELVVALDVAQDSVSLLRSVYGGRANVVVVGGDVCKNEVVRSLKAYNIDTVICLNVLEHMEDDLAMLTSPRNILVGGGVMLLLVPALKWLYGTMDELAGHYRRYEKGELRAKLEQSGFVVERLFFMNAPGVLGWYLNGKVFKQNHLSTPSISWQIRLYDRLFIPSLQWLERLCPPPLGQSLVAVARAQ